MIPVNHAVRVASNYIKELYQIDANSPDSPPIETWDFMLEEVKLSEDDNDWLITFSFLRRSATMKPIQEIRGITYDRVYKEILINGETGNPVSMEIRKI